MLHSDAILTVSELTRRIKTTIERGFKDVSVEGELSNCKLHSSGHFYFTLKDQQSQLQGVMWRNRAASLFFIPQDGMKVVVRGNITVYEVRGMYQIDATQLQPLGVGELQRAFELLKQKLAGLGYFDADRKKTIPRYPERVGIVTSPTGAALHDIYTVVNRRFPSVELILLPVKVQGEGAASEIAQAIRDFNVYGKIDLMIVGRGGGSLEDLWAFNEEIVARAIYDSQVPVISAVGHEIDFSISDFVADLRAPTPSVAAELAVPDRRELFEIVRTFQYTLEEVAVDLIAQHRQSIHALMRSYSFNKPSDIIRQHAQHRDELARRLDRVSIDSMKTARQVLAGLVNRLSSVNPRTVLKRGYAMVHKDGRTMSAAKELCKGDDVVLTFHDGELPAQVQ